MSVGPTPGNMQTFLYRDWIHVTLTHQEFVAVRISNYPTMGDATQNLFPWMDSISIGSVETPRFCTGDNTLMRRNFV